LTAEQDFPSRHFLLSPAGRFNFFQGQGGAAKMGKLKGKK
jgi:hypothetical protein